MFCRNCGNQCADTDNVCANCGTPLKEAPEAPKAPETPKAPKAAGFDLAPYVRYIALGVAALALIFGIMNLFGWYDVTVSAYGMSISFDVSDIYEGSTILMIANILYGVILLGVAGIAALYGLKELNGMPHYDNFIAKLPMGNAPLTLIGLAAVAGGVLQFILYLFVDGVSVSVSWITWVMTILGAGLVAVDKFVLNKK